MRTFYSLAEGMLCKRKLRYHYVKQSQINDNLVLINVGKKQLKLLLVLGSFGQSLIRGDVWGVGLIKGTTLKSCDGRCLGAVLESEEVKRNLVLDLFDILL